MKKLISIIVVAILILNLFGICVFAKADQPIRKYLKPGDAEWISDVTTEIFNLNTSGVDGAVSETPEENIFTYEGRSFIILDEEMKNDQTYFFVLCDEAYGIAMFDTDGDYGIWNPEDESNIAYWLNTEFWNNGYENMKLPEKIKEYIDKNHVWITEPISGLKLPDESGLYHDGINPIQTVNAISLLSRTEHNKYASEFGMNCSYVGNYTENYWFLRTAQSGNAERLGFAVGACGANKPLGKLTELSSASGMPKNTNRYRAFRPCFYLNSDFFAECKVNNVGENVALTIDEFCNADLYKTEEVFQNKINDLHIEGEPISGEVLESVYEYNGIFTVEDEEYEWLISDTADGEYRTIDNENKKTLMITPQMSGKYIKSKVKITTNSNVNPFAEAETNDCKAIISDYKVKETISNINNATADEIIDELSKDSVNKIFRLDLSLLNTETLEQTKINHILANIPYFEINDVRTGYELALAVGELNLITPPQSEEEKEIIEKITSILKTKILSLDFSRYDILNINQLLNVQKSIAGKGFVCEKTDDAKYNFDYEKHFYESIAYEELRTATRENIIEILSEHSKYFDINFDDLKTTRKEKMATLFLSEDFSDFDELKSAVKKAYKESDEEKEPSKPSKPSFSGGGSATSYSNARAQSEIKIEESKNKEEDIVHNNDVLYTDIAGFEWAEESIKSLTEAGIISGDGNGLFRPASTITREEFVKMAVVAFADDTQNNKEIPFEDVPDDSWCYEYVKKAYNLGIISGINEKEFGIGKEITREDIAVILYRLSGNKFNEEISDFSDYYLISEYAREAVAYMKNKGIINGTGNNSFEPKTPANRATVAKIIYGMLKEMK